MKAKEVLKVLQITRPTLCKYVKLGKIKVVRRPSGVYDYDDDSCYSLLNKKISRKCASNIGRKAFGDGFEKDLLNRGLGLNPVRRPVLTNQKIKGSK
jgi:hypothetical protein